MAGQSEAARVGRSTGRRRCVQRGWTRWLSAIHPAAVIGLLVLGVALLAGSVGYLGTSPAPASALALLVAVLLGALLLTRRLLA